MKDNEYVEQLDRLLASGNQSWLLGAGICYHANIPLMAPLTDRVLAQAAGQPTEAILQAIRAELPATSNIEHILSHIADYVALAERANSIDVRLGDAQYALELLRDAHYEALDSIAQTLRWGYVASHDELPEQIGTSEEPLVSVAGHVAFFDALLNRRQAGVSDRKRPIRLFTTNYDTLLEDALALGSFEYWDGFSGGAVAFRTHRYGQKEPQSGCRAHVIKLHGSIDWRLGEDGKVWRVRDNDTYPERAGRVLIYPQLTKYLATQRDPFASQFDLFRRSLCESDENLLAIVGYSFSDDHINQEIELALQHPDNKTTTIAFTSTLTPSLEKWRQSNWGNRLYVLTPHGLYVGGDGPFHEPSNGHTHDWWTFEGVVSILNNGAQGNLT